MSVLEELFAEAIALAPEEREAFLQRACAHDDSLRDRLERLLRAHRGAEHAEFLAGTAPAHPPAFDDPGDVGPGDRIGPYRLEELIAEGGFGRVWLARQRKPIARTVAFKIVKPGMEGRQVIARFDAERQALARMDHPGIAKILDAGTMPTSGRPYFVMEFVEGDSVTEYCDARVLEVRDRLEIFEKICLAVHHAHQKGVVHRDLKPTNVLVTEHDEVPVPKVIDFGIAKALERPLTDHTLQTEILQILGTPRYMSPEQARVGSEDVDTRTDIYSLGVLLYELLTGTTPFDAFLTTLDPVEIQRAIREELPPRPSLRVLESAERDELARRRRTDPQELAKALRGDLDRIVLMALEKDPGRRYDSAAALGNDVRRLLDHEPVLARRPSTGYLLWKFVQRHQVAATSATAIATALLIGIVLALGGLREASQQRDELQERLYDLYVTQARASRAGMLPGRRRRAFEAIERAAEIRVTDELRNEALACLGLTDVDLERQVPLDIGTLDIGPRLVDRALARAAPGRFEVVSTLTGEVLTTLSGPDSEPWLVVFSPRGEYVAASLVVDPTIGGRSLLLWSTEGAAEPVLELGRDEFLHNGVAFDRGASPPRWIAVAERDGRVRVRSLPDGELLTELPIPQPQSVTTLAGSPDGERLAISTQTDGTDLTIHRIADGAQVLAISPPAVINNLAWAAEGDRLAGSSMDAKVYLWSTEAGSLESTLEGHQAPTTRLAFDPSGKVLATSAWDDTVRLWDIALARPFIGPLRGELLVGLTDHLVTRRGGTVSCWNIERAIEVRRGFAPRNHGDPSSLALAPRGDLVVTAGESGIRLWDSETLSERFLVTEDATHAAYFDREGERLIASLRDELVTWPIDRSGGELRLGAPRTLARFDGIGPSAPNVHGSRIDVIAGGALHELDLEQGRVVRQLPGYRGVASVPSRSPDGRWLFTGTWRGEEAGAVWDSETGETVRRFPGVHVRGRFSPDGRWLCVGDRDAFTFLEVGSWREVRRIPRDNGDGIAGPIAFSGDGSVVALSYSRYRTLLVDPPSGRVHATLEHPFGVAASQYAFDERGSLLLLVTPTRELLAWDLSQMRARLRGLGLDWGDAAPTE